MGFADGLLPAWSAGGVGGDCAEGTADGLTAEVKQRETALAAQQKAIEAEKNKLAVELASTEQALDGATAARTELLTQTEPRLVALFEHVMRARKGVAVCAAADGHCTICHVRLRPQVFNTVLRNNEIVQCDSCQRILYYVPKTTTASLNPEP